MATNPAQRIKFIESIKAICLSAGLADRLTALFRSTVRTLVTSKLKLKPTGSLCFPTTVIRATDTSWTGCIMNFFTFDAFASQQTLLLCFATWKSLRQLRPADIPLNAT